MSFAEQKLQEVVCLAQKITVCDAKCNHEPLVNFNRDNSQNQSKFDATKLTITHYKKDQKTIETAWEQFRRFSPINQIVQLQIKSLTTKDFERSISYDLRCSLQISLPAFPTTTIGSFPQTSEVRKLRVRYKRGEINQEDYQTAIKVQIFECIKIQEEAEIDVLVHGEFERTDMVEYFARQLQGFAFTQNGWIQSYGSRSLILPNLMILNILISSR